MKVRLTVLPAIAWAIMIVMAYTSMSTPAAGFALVPSRSSPSLIHRAWIPSTTTTTTATTRLFAKPKRKEIIQNVDDMQTINATTLTMPANLKRKVHAKRPALGHVVPRHLKNPNKKSSITSNTIDNTIVGGGSSNPYLRPQGKAREAGLNNPSLLKILGGSAKGRRLDSPQVYLRPMMGKVKEAVFSTFNSLGLYDCSHSKLPIRHLDIFSGSGSVGLESLSRGATHCTFVDFSDDCCAAATRNMEWCFGNSNNGNDGNVDFNKGNGKDDSTATARKTFQIVTADYLVALRDPASVGIDPLVPYHIVTLCPPYEEVVYADLLEAVANSPLVSDDTVVLVEYPVELQTLPHVIRRKESTASSDTATAGGALIGIRNRKYGRTVIAMYVCNPTGKLQGADSRPEEFV